MSTVHLPNIRKLFIPDPDHYIAECDLSGADAQVYAWDSSDEDLKTAFKNGLKIHLKNARDVFPEKTKGMSNEAIKATDYPGGIYHDCKRAVHATTYGVAARSLAGKIGWTTSESERFQRNWFGLHPAILEWHRYTQRCLNGQIPNNPPRTIRNAFGYRIVYFDRADGLLPEALAWKPQSTVAITCIKGALAIRERTPWVSLLMQVHDSLLFQFHSRDLYRLREVHTALHSVVIPYPDPLVIPWTLKLGVRSWGEAEERSWKDYL